MALTSAHTRTYASTAAMANLAVHNKRAFDEDHPAPWYLLSPEHHDPRGNISIETSLTPARVFQEYLETNAFGRKHGRLHHKARPFRETVVVCQESTTRADVDKLMKEMERRLPFRCMYGHLHRDEGRVDKKTGKVIKNWHIHIGYTNLIDGKLVDPGKKGLSQLQDICAEVLGMKRGELATETNRMHLEPKKYRRLAQEKEKAVMEEQARTKEAEDEIDRLNESMLQNNSENKSLKDRNTTLVTNNVRLKDSLERSNAAREADDRALDRLKNDPDLDLGKELDTAEDLANKIVEKNRELRKKIQESGMGSPQIYKGLNDIKKSGLPRGEKLIAMAKYVDRVTAQDPAPSEKTLETSDEKKPTLQPEDIYPRPGKPPRHKSAFNTLELPGSVSPGPSTPAPAPAVPLFADMMRDWMEQQAEESENKIKDLEGKITDLQTSVDEVSNKATQTNDKYDGLLEICRPYTVWLSGLNPPEYPAFGNAMTGILNQFLARAAGQETAGGGPGPSNVIKLWDEEEEEKKKRKDRGWSR